ncbi:MAG: hypothetical protein D6805_06800 [Planctomycetota bacterium]|nr:MAG: hypothetical protein D6805_06800 [Planctomycetota bacterium]
MKTWRLFAFFFLCTLCTSCPSPEEEASISKGGAEKKQVEGAEKSSSTSSRSKITQVKRSKEGTPERILLLTQAAQGLEKRQSWQKAAQIYRQLGELYKKSGKLSKAEGAFAQSKLCKKYWGLYQQAQKGEREREWAKAREAYMGILKLAEKTSQSWLKQWVKRRLELLKKSERFFYIFQRARGAFQKQNHIQALKLLNEAELFAHTPEHIQLLNDQRRWVEASHFLGKLRAFLKVEEYAQAAKLAQKLQKSYQNYLREGKADCQRAIELWENYRNYKALIKKAKNAVEKGLWQEAWRSYMAAFQIFPQKRKYFQVELAGLQKHLEDGNKFQEIRRQFQNMEKLSAPKLQLLLQAIRQYLLEYQDYRSEVERMRKEVLKALEAHRQRQYRALLKELRSHYQARRYLFAKSLADEILKKHLVQNPFEVYFLLAKIAYQQKDYNRALQWYQRGESSGKLSPEMILEKAHCLFQTNRPAAALNTLLQRQDIYKNPESLSRLKGVHKNPDALYLQARCFEAAKRPFKAYQVYDYLRRTFPKKYPYAYKFIGDFLLKNQQKNAAAEHYEKFVDLADASVLREIMETEKKLLKIKKEDLIYQVKILKKLTQKYEAMGAWKAAMQSYISLSEVYEKMGKKSLKDWANQNAQRCFNESSLLFTVSQIKRAISRKDFKSAEKFLLIAKKQAKTSKHQETLRQVETNLHASQLFQKALGLFEKKKYPQALQAFQHILQKFPNALERSDILSYIQKIQNILKELAQVRRLKTEIKKFLEKKDYSQALQGLEDLLRYPQHVDIAKIQEKIFYVQKELEKERIYKIKIKVEKKLKQALALAKQREFEQAIDILQDILKKHPLYSDVESIQYHIAKFRKKIQKIALIKRRQKAQNILQKAQNYLAKRQYPKAIQTFRLLLQHYSAYIDTSKVRHQLQEVKAQYQEYLRLLQIEKQIKSLETRASALSAKQQWKKAAEVYQQLYPLYQKIRNVAMAKQALERKKRCLQEAAIQEKFAKIEQALQKKNWPFARKLCEQVRPLLLRQTHHRVLKKFLEALDDAKIWREAKKCLQQGDYAKSLRLFGALLKRKTPYLEREDIQKKLEIAKEKWNRYLQAERRKKEAQKLWQQAKKHFEEKNYTTSIQNLKRLLSQYSDSTDSARVKDFLQQVQAAYRTYLYTQKREELEKKFQHHLSQAQKAEYSQNWKLALDHYQQALGIFPKKAPLYREKIQKLRFHLKDQETYNKIKSLAQKAFYGNISQMKQALQLADQYLSKYQDFVLPVKKLKEKLQKALKAKKKEQYQAKIKAAKNLFQKRDFAKVAQICSQTLAQKLVDKPKEALWLAALSYKELAFQGKNSRVYVQKSIDNFQGLRRLKLEREIPNFVESFTELLFYAKRFSECFKILSQYQENVAKSRKLSFLKGHCLRRLNRLEEAFQVYQKLLAQSPARSPKIYKFMGDYLFAKKKEKEAISYYKRFLTLAKAFPLLAEEVSKVKKRLESLERNTTTSPVTTSISEKEKAEIAKLFYALKNSTKKKELKQIAIALSKMGKKVLPLLLRTLKDRKQPERVRVYCAYAIGKMGPQAGDSVPVLVRLLSDASALVRARCAWSLGKLGPRAKSALSALQKAISDPNPKVQRAAFTALQRLKSYAK